jgi:hypothetical protein
VKPAILFFCFTMPGFNLAQTFDTRHDGFDRVAANKRTASTAYMLKSFTTSTREDKRIEQETSVFYQDREKALRSYRTLLSLGIDKLSRSELLRITIALYYVSPIQTKLTDVTEVFRRWDRCENIRFVEYRWRTYAQVNQIGGPDLLVALKKIDLELKDNYYTQRLIVALSGIRPKDIEYGLALGKKLATKYPDHADPQHLYGLILWDLAYQTKNSTKYDLAKEQLVKASRCKFTTPSKKAAILDDIKNIDFSKAKFATK